MQVIQVPPDNVSCGSYRSRVDLSALEELDHEVEIYYLSEL